MTDGAKVRIFRVVYLAVIGVLLAFWWFLLARGDVPKPLLWTLVAVMVVALPTGLWTSPARSRERVRRKAERNASGSSTVA
jgi:cation transport ATPase